ncbi:hypothetical protein HF690_04320 [Oleiagrimonas citrea]|uniref:Uncharacterized protein n=1 Tax=Oleiagrimonas citrea TaxID=1665687 RepID=A0A846ZKW3_9GAMM|nr:hypothetical protein [Oleiagrimonas citrea]NKZ38178.1 hypothetical protein [Oleiagrimonas citrea]
MPVFDEDFSAADVGRCMLADTWRSAVSVVPAAVRTQYASADACADVLAALPSLGAVLCHVVDAVPPGAACASRRLWAAHPWLAAMSSTVAVDGYAHVDQNGPCEWLECRQASGRSWMRIVLLPDSDYCAWDALLHGSARSNESSVATTMCATRVAWMRGLRGGGHGRVAVVRFRLHIWAGQSWLSMIDAPVSRLGRVCAEQRARQWHLGKPGSCRVAP